MGNRMLKDSIHTSLSVSSMTDFQFRLWVNLITYVDDYGRGIADPAIIKGFCFPLMTKVTTANIKKSTIELAKNGSIVLYEVEDKLYLYFPNWDDHQRVRSKISKFPGPEDGKVLFFGVSPQSAASCGELRQSAASCGNPRLETKPNRNQEETNIETNLLNGFDGFWAEYPKKVKKQEAVKAWKKAFLVHPDLTIDRLMDSLFKHKRSMQWTKDGGRYVPDPTTWLNQARWEDELPEEKNNGNFGTARNEHTGGLVRYSNEP